MVIWGDEYSKQRGGSMQFWDSLSEDKKRRCEMVASDLVGSMTDALNEIRELANEDIRTGKAETTFIYEIAEIVGLRDSEPELCRKTKKLVRNMKRSHEAMSRQFEKIGKELYPVRQKRDTGEPSRADHLEIRDLITAIRGIQTMAEEDIRLGRADGTFIQQIEANAKAVLSGNGRRTMLTPENERGGIIDN